MGEPDFEAMPTDDLWRAYEAAKVKYDRMNIVAHGLTQSKGDNISLEQKRNERVTRNKLIVVQLETMNAIALVLHKRLVRVGNYGYAREVGEGG